MSIISALIILPFPFAANSALSATTANVIHGTAPYLTFDGGTPAANTEALLSITLSNNATYAKRKSGEVGFDSSNPIRLPVANQTMADVMMNVPTTASSIDLNTLIGAPNNYWKDDDGDGGITVTGTLSVKITDKGDATVGRNEVLIASKAPYKVVLTSSAGTLKTKYGKPNERALPEVSATYYIKPKIVQAIYAEPNLRYGDDTGEEPNGRLGYKFAGPTEMWDTSKGFKAQSSYAENFPTTGANNLYFTLNISGVSGVDATKLKWGDAPAAGGAGKVVVNGITATMVPTSAIKVTVTLTGPAASAAQKASDKPGKVDKPTLPTEIVLAGKDSSGNVAIDYGFVLKQWFINRGSTTGNASTQTAWCTSTGYLMPRVQDLTSANGNGWTGGLTGNGNNYKRIIGGGLFSEWGFMGSYTGSDWVNSDYWTSDTGASQFSVRSYVGVVHSDTADTSLYGACRSQ